MNHSEGLVRLGGDQNADASLKIMEPSDFPGREQPYEHRFSPYDFNGGTVAGVSGDDYLVLAADTRMSTGYEILSRNTSKLHQLNANSILASSGCKTDMDQLRSVLDIKMKVRSYFVLFWFDLICACDPAHIHTCMFCMFVCVYMFVVLCR